MSVSPPSPSAGEINEGYWAFMAAPMALKLKEVAEGKETRIDYDVLLDAIKLFKVILAKETGDDMFDNPPAQTSAFVMALGILSDSQRSKLRAYYKGEEANSCFQRFENFLKRLNDQPTAYVRRLGGFKQISALSDADRITAGELSNFFATLFLRVFPQL